MPLFHDKRDANFINHVNRELMQRIVDTEIDVYKVDLSKTKKNLYEEAVQKWYLDPVRVNCLINRQPQNWAGDDLGQDYTESTDFAFFRDILVDMNLVLEVGDIFWYNGEWWEIGSIVENQYFGGKNPERAISGTDWGFNVSIIAGAHVTRRSIQRIEKTFSGINTDTTTPRGI